MAPQPHHPQRTRSTRTRVGMGRPSTVCLDESAVVVTSQRKHPQQKSSKQQSSVSQLMNQQQQQSGYQALTRKGQGKKVPVSTRSNASSSSSSIASSSIPGISGALSFEEFKEMRRASRHNNNNNGARRRSSEESLAANTSSSNSGATSKGRNSLSSSSVNGAYSMAAVSRTSIKSSASPSVIPKQSISGAYSATNVSRTSTSVRSSSNNNNNSGGFIQHAPSFGGASVTSKSTFRSATSGTTATTLSYDQFKQLRKESEALRREHVELYGEESVRGGGSVSVGRVSLSGVSRESFGGGNGGSMMGKQQQQQEQQRHHSKEFNHSTATEVASNIHHDDDVIENSNINTLINNNNIKRESLDTLKSAAKLTAKTTAQVSVKVGRASFKASKEVAKVTGKATIKGAKATAKATAKGAAIVSKELNRQVSRRLEEQQQQKKRLSREDMHQQNDQKLESVDGECDVNVARTVERKSSAVDRAMDGAKSAFDTEEVLRAGAKLSQETTSAVNRQHVSFHSNANLCGSNNNNDNNGKNDEGLFPDVLGKNVVTSDNAIASSMSILTDEDGFSHRQRQYNTTTRSNQQCNNQQSLHKDRLSNDHQRLTKSVKKATKNIVNTSNIVATTVVHTTNVVAPKIANATTKASKVVASNVVVAAKAAHVIAGEVAVVTRESMDAAKVTVDTIMANAKTPARSNVGRMNQAQQQNVGVEGQRYADYISDPNYKVVLTPQPPAARGNHKYVCDPTTPHCLLGAVTAGICALPENHPDHPEYLPEGVPRMIDIRDDWEERAGFVSVKVVDGGDEVCMARTTFDTQGEGMPYLAERNSYPIDMDDTVQGSVVDENDCIAEEQDAFERALMNVVEANQDECDDVEEENDPRNHSMWVAVNEEEDINEEDEFMNVGDIIIGSTFDEEDEQPVVATEFFSQELIAPAENSPMSCGTFFIGDLEVESNSPDTKTLYDAVSMARALIETVSTEEDIFVSSPVVSKLEDEVAEYVSETLPAAQPKATEDGANNVRDQMRDFETPYSVQKGERALTFTEFKTMNKRVLFNSEHEEVSVNEHKLDDEQLYTTNYAHETKVVSNEATLASTSKPDSGKRVLKGRVLLLKVVKKISKAKSKGKNVLRQVFLLPQCPKPRSDAVANAGGDKFALVMPKSFPMPMSPASVSVASIASSIMSHGSSSSKRIIGAVPVYAATHPLGLPYGAIDYNRSVSDSTVDGTDALPPPPTNVQSEAKDSSGDADEDAVSYIAAAMKADPTDGGVVVEENETEEESSVFLLVAETDGPEESYRVISGFDGSTPVPVKDIVKTLSDGDSPRDSEIKPNNLAGLFTDGSKSSQGTSYSIMDAGEGQYVLTPTAAKHNVKNVFRQEKGTPSGAANAPITGAHSNLLPGSTCESDDDEDETLLYHDGCTVIRHTSTFGDNTIATATSARPMIEETVEDQKEEDEQPTTTPAPKESRLAVLDTPAGLSPDGPSFTKQAATNGSFLFSPNNMGRAGPRIRAQERAALKEGKVAPSITMLPASKREGVSSAVTTIAPMRQSYSSAASDVANTTMPLIAIEPAIEFRKSDASSIAVEIQKKPVVLSVTEPRQFSFKSTLSKFSAVPTDALAQNEEVSAITSSTESTVLVKRDEFATPLVTNCAPKKTYPATPFPENMAATENVDTPVAIAIVANQEVISPANSSSGSIGSSVSKKKQSLKHKNVPKSALKTRKGLVKDRISDIQQRLEVSSAVTDVNGRLKKNHSYKLKNVRRMTNGDKVLAPRKAVLQNPIFIRSVPIGIAKSYSKDESELNGAVSIENSRLSFSGDEKEDESNSYASKYNSNCEKITHNGSSPSSDASSYVSESTECDPFNSLLGKMSIEEVDSDDVVSPEKSIAINATKDKENADANNIALSSDRLLTFKSESSLVKPTEINQHDRRPALVSKSSRDLHLSSLQRTPMQARKWRTMAAAAAEKKTGSARFV
ncbi:predicted protein [Thalassiosira pseudonana CCMP1335]|uniref:Uncharacterized protein n=1 Tax=Thalassiosira pseudonana TaxID=35128 RepID=B8LEX7_THAPS|nr:predicted protein [Thalassiosira pseudonana CCMP1335]EED86104.1 predicted protein [Thalassiosira pseudonana CCMP1335]